MNILIVSTYFPPQHSIASLRVYSFAKNWASDGNQVTVLTPRKLDEGNLNINISSPEYSLVELPHLGVLQNLIRLKQRQLHRNANRKIDCSKGTTYDKRKNPLGIIIEEAGLIKKRYGIFTTARMPNVHDTWIPKAVRKGKAIIDLKNIDMIFSSYGPPASHIIAGILAKSSDKPWFADYRDLWIEHHIYPGAWPFKFFEKLLEQRYVGKYAKTITTVSEPLGAVLRDKFNVPVYVIENGYDSEEYKQQLSPYFTDHKTRIIYTGTIYDGKQDPSPLFSAIAQLIQDDGGLKIWMENNLRVSFFGRTSESLLKAINRYNLFPIVQYKGAVSRQAALQIQKQADMLIYLEWGDESVQGILTGKIFEYLVLKKPVLSIGKTSKASSGSKLLKDTGVGFIAGNDVSCIKSVLLSLIKTGKPFNTNPDDKIIEKYSRQNLSKKLLDLMKEAI
jgi:glycosyltransferase involved in cell wall biosynthesis